MMGQSRRFLQAGYVLPKYMLPLWGKNVFQAVVSSFEHYFASDVFIFICRKSENEVDFIKKNVEELRINKAKIITLNTDTEGQADTVWQGLKKIEWTVIEDLFLFNIDTIRRNFRKPQSFNLGDGYLEVFRGEGEHWSFIKPGENFEVLETAEKNRISNYCSNGLYYFRNFDIFSESIAFAKHNQKLTYGEYYIAPLYNYLIYNGYKVRYSLASREEIIFCGTPDEYKNLVKY